MSTPTTAPPHNPATATADFMTDLQQAGAEQETKAIAPPPEKTEEKPPEKPVVTPPAKPEEKPKETPAPANDDDKWPRSAKDWDARKAAQKEKELALTKERDSIRTERDRLNDEIKALKSNGNSPELESLKKERDELSEHLRKVAVENHPKFKKYFDDKTTNQLNLAKAIVGTEKAEQVAALLKSPESAIREQQLESMLAELSPLQQTRLGGVINAMSEIQAERQSEIAKAKDTYEHMTKQQEEGAKAARQKFEQLFDSAVKRAGDTKEGVAAYQNREGDDAWNEGVKKRVEIAKSILTGNSKPELIVEAALMAAAAPEFLKSHQAVLEENNRLKTQIAEMSSANPTVDTKTATTGSETAQAPKAKPGSSPMDVLRDQWMPQMKQAAEQGA